MFTALRRAPIRHRLPRGARHWFRLPGGRLSSSGEASVTVVTMFCFATAGWMFQEYVLDKTLRKDGTADMHAKVKEIMRLELEAIRREGEAEARVAAPSK